jgi:hypothetical protein
VSTPGEGSKPEGRSAAELLGRRPVAQDQTAHDARVIRSLERFGDGRESALPDLDLDSRIGKQVLRPEGAIAGCNEDRAIGLVDIADRDRSGESGQSTARGEPGDLALEEQVVADVVRRRIRQRARCQDLPSVWVDGA